MPGGHILNTQFPEVEPNAPGAPSENIPTNPGMFGAFGAQAEEKLGGGITTAADTGLDYLRAKQSLLNETHASELNTWLANNITDKFADFNKLEGRAASDALPGFKKEIEQLYQDHLAKAGNNLQLQAQLAKSGRYLTDAYYRYATNYADQQFRGWQDKTATNRAAVFGAQAMVAQKNGDLPGMEVALNTSDDEVRKLYEQRGWDKDATDQAVLKNRGHNLKNIIEGVAANDALAGAALYRKYEGQMDADTSREVQKSLRAGVEKAIGYQKGADALRGTYQTAPAPAQVQPVLDQVGAKYGVSSSYLLRTWQIESGGQISPKDSPTGARGPFQFIGSTARQYGVTNPNDFTQSAEGAARLAVDNRASLAAGLERPPTDAELYLAHQQGADGALKLLQNPATRAGSLVGDRAIAVNGGDPNAPASAFTGMWTAKFNGAGPAASLSRKAAAYQVIASDPNLTDNQRDYAIQRVNRDISMQMQAEEETQQQRTLRDQDASNEYVTKILTGQPVDLNAMANDPRLLPNTKVHLNDLATNKGLTDDPLSFGPKYVDTYRRILAGPDSPDRITSASQILELGQPGGGLSIKGVDRLMKIYGEVRNQKLGENDPTSVNQAKVSLLQYAKSKLSFEQDTGPVKIRDPKGEAIFNARFIPKFEAAYNEWIKQGKDPWQFLNQDNVDNLMNGMRSKAEMQQDRIAATGEATGEGANPNAPQAVPPAPEGVKPEDWATVIGKPPTTASGRPWPLANWAAAVNDLRSNPAPDRIKAFDEHFAPAGITAKDVLTKLRGPGALGGTLPAEATSPAAGELPPGKLPPPEKTSYLSPSGPGPAALLGNVIRAVTPQRVQDYVANSGR